MQQNKICFLNSLLSEWMTEQGQQEIIKSQKLLQETKEVVESHERRQYIKDGKTRTKSNSKEMEF